VNTARQSSLQAQASSLQPATTARLDFVTPSKLQLMLDSGRSVPAGVPLGADELKVLACLRLAFGQGGAVPLKEIGRQTELADRAIKGVVESLRSVHRLDVGACRAYRRSVGGPQEAQLFGYYWVQTADELLDTVGPYYHQALTMLRTVETMTRGRRGLRRLLAEKFGQLPLFQEPAT